MVAREYSEYSFLSAFKNRDLDDKTPDGMTTQSTGEQKSSKRINPEKIQARKSLFASLFSPLQSLLTPTGFFLPEFSFLYQVIPVGLLTL